MRRNGLLFGGWALATLLALVLGLQSIRSVSNSVTSARPEPLSPASVRAALHRSSTTSSSSSAASAAESSTDAAQESKEVPSETVIVVPGSDESTPVPSSTPSTPTTSSSQSTASSSDHGSENSSSGRGSSSSSSSSAPQERTFQLAGGTVTIRFEDGAAHFVVATANSGFSVEHSENGGTVDVRFESNDHESRLRAWWDGEPRWEIEENEQG